MSHLIKKHKVMGWIVAAIIIGLILISLYKFINQPDVTTNIDSSQTRLDHVAPVQQQLGSNNSTPLTTPSSQSNPNAFKTGVENLPRSLQDTSVDGEIIIDGNQNLVPTRGLRRLYDYFLSALGEESSETIDARVEAYITSRTPEPAASTAVALYYTYKNYLERLSTLQSSYGNLQLQATQAGELDINLINQRQNDVNKIRAELFQPKTVTAFFGDEDQLQDYNLAMIEASKDPNLTQEQREQIQHDYISRLPESILKERVEQKQNFQTLIRRTEQLKANGASDAELFAMRSELVGAPAAQRLAEVDHKNKDFDQRFQQYQNAKEQIALSTNDDITKQNQIAALEGQLFNEAEQKRLTGYALIKSMKQE